jgi:hypothetical protein
LERKKLKNIKTKVKSMLHLMRITVKSLVSLRKLQSLFYMAKIMKHLMLLQRLLVSYKNRKKWMKI